MPSLSSDIHGRSISVTTVGTKDVYTVGDNLFKVSVPVGTPEDMVLRSINSMAPEGYTAPSGVAPPYRGLTVAPFFASSPLMNLPVDITTGEPGDYIVGSNVLDVYIQGLKATIGSQYEEVGEKGEVSTQVQLLIDIEEGFTIEFVRR